MRRIPSLRTRVKRLIACAGLAAIFFIDAAQIVSASKPPTPEEAIEKQLAHQSHQWQGMLCVQRSDGTNKTFRLLYDQRKTGNNRYEGHMTIVTTGTEPATWQAEKLDLIFQGRPGSPWHAKIGPLGGFTAQSLHDLDGKSNTSVAVWSGSGLTFETALNPEALDLTFSGYLPLPESIGKGSVWSTARLGRAGFRFSIGSFEINFWECLGLLGSLLFGVRFVIQLVASERAKKSVTPLSFWWVSLLATLLYTIYGFYFQRISIVLGQTMGWYVYVRNIILIKAHKKVLAEETISPTADAVRKVRPD